MTLNTEDFDEVNKWIHTDNYGKILASPVDLNLAKMKRVNLPLLLWYNYEYTPKKMKLTNTGKTAVLSVTWPRNQPHLASGPLTDNYTFSQVHFHWGQNEMVGSEHLFDGGRQAMELHAVHFNSKYQSQSNAMREHDGIVILVYMFKLQSTPNPNLNEIIKSLNLIQDPETSTRVTPEPIINILRPFTDDYFLYKGTLKVKNHEREIIWIICRAPIGISINQVAEFRNLNNTKFEKNMDNCRVMKDDKNITQVFHVCPSGYSYASLLQVPSGPIPLTETQKNNQQNIIQE